MSFPEWPLILSPEARDDLADILRYTGERWGQDRLYSYRDRLNDVLLSINRYVSKVCSIYSGVNAKLDELTLSLQTDCVI